MKKIAVLTSGGDAPGMNAALRAVVRTALVYDFIPYIVYEGFQGLVEDKIEVADRRFVSDIINKGGTKIGTSRYKEFHESSYQEKAAKNLKAKGIDNLIVIGGNGSVIGADKLTDFGINVILIPATIDNDVNVKGKCIGFDTAINTIIDAIDKIRDTTNSHKRCSIIEVMGRRYGDLALVSGIASGADIIITSEHKLTKKEIFEKIKNIKQSQRKHVLIVVSENTIDIKQLATEIKENFGIETIINVLGYLQRGGKPSCLDRYLASILGAEAVNLIDQKQYNFTLSFANDEFIKTSFEISGKTKIMDKDKIYKYGEIIE